MQRREGENTQDIYSFIHTRKLINPDAKPNEIKLP